MTLCTEIQRIVVMYLPNYGERYIQYLKHIGKTFYSVSIYEIDIFMNKHFAEALAERDRQMKKEVWEMACQRQREIIASSIPDKWAGLIDNILHFYTPKMEE